MQEKFKNISVYGIISPQIIKKHRWKLLLSFLTILLILNLGQKLYVKIFYKTFLNPPGVIVKLIEDSGIGNQLFRYACSYALAKKYNLPLYLYLPDYINLKDASEVDNNNNAKFIDPNSRKFALDQFHIPMKNLINSRTWYEGSDTFEFNDWHLLYKRNELVEQIKMNKLLIHADYCESETFFTPYEQDIREMFVQNIGDSKLTKNVQRWVDIIEDAGEFSIAVHIRRGDYAKKGNEYWLTPIDFYRKAMEVMSEHLSGNNVTVYNSKFFIFSDDINYVKKHLLVGIGNSSLIFENVHFVSERNMTTSLEEFYLMTRCKHMIVANSTFSWWAAYLIRNKRKIVIGPKFNPKFTEHYNDEYKRDFKKFVFSLWYPSDWIVIDPYSK